MEQEVLFTSVKWDVLRELSQADKSPIELSAHNTTSMSNISQALRFLEIAGLVKSKRIPNRDKGQPRVVYSLKNDFAYVIIAADGFAEKRLIELDQRKKSLLRIWLYEDETVQPFLEKAFDALFPYLNQILAVFYDNNSSSNKILVRIIPKKESLKRIPSDIAGEFYGIKKNIEFNQMKQGEIEKKKSFLYPIYDPQKLYGGGNS